MGKRRSHIFGESARVHPHTADRNKNTRGQCTEHSGILFDYTRLDIHRTKNPDVISIYGNLLVSKLRVWPRESWKKNWGQTWHNSVRVTTPRACLSLMSLRTGCILLNAYLLIREARVRSPISFYWIPLHFSRLSMELDKDFSILQVKRDDFEYSLGSKPLQGERAYPRLPAVNEGGYQQL